MKIPKWAAISIAVCGLASMLGGTVGMTSQALKANKIEHSPPYVRLGEIAYERAELEGDFKDCVSAAKNESVFNDCYKLKKKCIALGQEEEQILDSPKYARLEEEINDSTYYMLGSAGLAILSPGLVVVGAVAYRKRIREEEADREEEK